MRQPVHVEGLQTLRRSLRATDKAALKEVQKVTRDAARIVAAQAGRNAPRGTRPIPPSRKPRVRLADSFKGTTSGAKGIVRSPLPHAPIVEYRRSGTAAQMRNIRPVGRAIEAKQDVVLQSLARGFDDVARRNGWK